MVKAVFFDIDGTLLGSSHHLLPGTVDALETMRKQGILTFISSGRPMVLIPPMPVAFNGYITVNGGYCIVGEDVLLQKPIDPDDCANWLKYVSDNGKTTMCFTANDMYINQIDQTTVSLRDQLGFQMPPLRPLDQLHGLEVYQFIALQPESDDSKVLQFLPHCRLPRWHPVFSDIIPVGSSKAVGIECIIKHFGIKRDETMAFGDGANDIEMLEYAGIGVAMGNASEIVKQHADHVTSDVDDEGIAKALVKLNVIPSFGRRNNKFY